MNTKFITHWVLWAYVLASAAVALWVELSHYGCTPLTASGPPMRIVVSAGQSFKATAGQLAAAGIVREPIKLRLLARLHGMDAGVKAGEYGLAAHQSPLEILAILNSGRVILHRLTIAEGLNFTQVALKVSQGPWAISKEQFLKAAADPVLIQRLGLPGPTVEGYLFPDTYFFPISTTAEQIIAAMVRRFMAVFDASMIQRAAQGGFSVHQVVTLASIIEKETGAAAERPLIASVFHNRLKKGMRLAADPTVIYAIGDFDGNLTRRHLETPSPYNTYLNTGLPPGPIANPGRHALEAALNPAPTDLLYFVSKNDGTHHFSATFDAHNRAVRHFQLKGKAKPRDDDLQLE
jgi:UPF0755 protein